MRAIRTFFWVLSAAALAFAGVIFYNQNLELVAVEFAKWSTVSMPLASVLLISFSMGALAAGVYFILDVLRLRSQFRRSRKMCDILNRELDALRNAPLYDELPSETDSDSNSFEQHLTHEGQPEESVDSPDPKRTS